jgi:hypothetical protein
MMPSFEQSMEDLKKLHGEGFVELVEKLYMACKGHNGEDIIQATLMMVVYACQRSGLDKLEFIEIAIQHWDAILTPEAQAYMKIVRARDKAEQEVKPPKDEKELREIVMKTKEANDRLEARLASGMPMPPGVTREAAQRLADETRKAIQSWLDDEARS